MSQLSDLSPRAARTRTALIAAGFELLAAKPIDAIPIDEVVARAGVAKGSFFNHFLDKHAFAAAIASEVRLELEAHITRANQGVASPIERIANGMRVCAEFALRDRMRTAVLLRASNQMTARSHPLNKGITEDFAQAACSGLIRPEAEATGVLYWIGLCHVLMVSILEAPDETAAIQPRLGDMLVLGLTGLGVERRVCVEIATRSAVQDGEDAAIDPS